MFVHPCLNPVGNAESECLFIFLILEQGTEHIYVFRRCYLDIAAIAGHHMRLHALAADNRTGIYHIFITFRTLSYLIMRGNNIFEINFAAPVPQTYLFGKEPTRHMFRHGLKE